MDTLETIVVVLIVAAVAVWVGRRLWRVAAGRDGPCGSCSRDCRHRGAPEGESARPRAP